MGWSSPGPLASRRRSRRKRRCASSATSALRSVRGYGIVSVAAHLVGRQIQEMIGHFVAGRNGEAAAAHRRLRPFFNSMFVTTNPIPLKYALRKVGFDVGSVRLPLVEPDEK